MKKFLTVLNRCPLFSEIACGDLEALLGCICPRIKDHLKGEIIMEAGDPATMIGIVLSGSVQVIREDYYGNRSMMGKLGPGDMFAEAFACSGMQEMPVSVMATEASQIMLIESCRITQSCAHACGFHHQLIYNLMKILATKNLLCNEKIEVTSKRTTREKLLTYLMLQAQKVSSSDFEIPFNRQELADYLEVDRSGLSAEISKLRREGLLVCQKNRFKLLLEK